MALDIFYTLPIPIDRHPYLQWCEDPKLKLYIQREIADRVEVPIDNDLALLLVERIQAGSVSAPSLNCTTALLASLLLSGARGRWLRFDISDIFDKLQQYYASSGLEIQDVYAIALGIISDPARFLRNFNLEPSGDMSDRLAIWGRTTLTRRIVDEIRKLAGLENFKRTNLGVLKRSSENRVRESLIANGEPEGESLEILLTIHLSLVETVTAKTFNTKDPQPVHYDALLARYRYHADRMQLPQLDRDRLQQLLTNMGNTLRRYERPPTDSLDRQIGVDTEGGAAKLGDLVGNTAIDGQYPFAARIAAELSSIDLQVAKREIYERLKSLLSQLPIEQQRLLMLRDGLQLNETAAGKEFGCNQTTIMRRRDRVLAELVRSLAKGEVTAETLNEIDTGIKEYYLPIYYFQIFDEMLDLATSTDSESRKAEFIELIQDRWQFTFVTGQNGIEKAKAFVLRSQQSR